MFYSADNMAAASEAHGRFYPNMLCGPIHYRINICFILVAKHLIVGKVT